MLFLQMQTDLDDIENLFNTIIRLDVVSTFCASLILFTNLFSNLSVNFQKLTTIYIIYSLVIRVAVNANMSIISKSSCLFQTVNNVWGLQLKQDLPPN